MARLFAGGACALSLSEFPSLLAISATRLFFKLALALDVLDGAVLFASRSTSEVMGVSAKDSGRELKHGDALDAGVAVSDDLETSLVDWRVTLAMTSMYHVQNRDERLKT